MYLARPCPRPTACSSSRPTYHPSPLTGLHRLLRAVLSSHLRHQDRRACPALAFPVPSAPDVHQADLCIARVPGGSAPPEIHTTLRVPSTSAFHTGAVSPPRPPAPRPVDVPRFPPTAHSTTRRILAPPRRRCGARPRVIAVFPPRPNPRCQRSRPRPHPSCTAVSPAFFPRAPPPILLPTVRRCESAHYGYPLRHSALGPETPMITGVRTARGIWGLLPVGRLIRDAMCEGTGRRTHASRRGETEGALLLRVDVEERGYRRSSLFLLFGPVVSDYLLRWRQSYLIGTKGGTYLIGVERGSCAASFVVLGCCAEPALA
ncbi:hypothetical protein C8J57DRAFT_1720469 [Mycena rebaudengoi]|nr:hypothetical protein C8J57DRAFT_1720469 [Mycena rebaudengoi]